MWQNVNKIKSTCHARVHITAMGAKTDGDGVRGKERVADCNHGSTVFVWIFKPVKDVYLLTVQDEKRFQSWLFSSLL